MKNNKIQTRDIQTYAHQVKDLPYPHSKQKQRFMKNNEQKR